VAGQRFRSHRFLFSSRSQFRTASFGSVHIRAVPLANVNEMALDCRGRCHYRADEVRATAFALASFEIAI
jgi:hypothetical protein